VLYFYGDNRHFADDNDESNGVDVAQQQQPDEPVNDDERDNAKDDAGEQFEPFAREKILQQDPEQSKVVGQQPEDDPDIDLE